MTSASVSITALPYYSIPKDQTDCPICYSPFNELAPIVGHTKGGDLHPFHRECLEEYLKKNLKYNSNCPGCKQPFDKQSIELLVPQQNDSNLTPRKIQILTAAIGIGIVALFENHINLTKTLLSAGLLAIATSLQPHTQIKLANQATTALKAAVGGSSLFLASAAGVAGELAIQRNRISDEAFSALGMWVIALTGLGLSQALELGAKRTNTLFLKLSGFMLASFAMGAGALAPTRCSISTETLAEGVIGTVEVITGIAVALTSVVAGLRIKPQQSNAVFKIIPLAIIGNLFANMVNTYTASSIRKFIESSTENSLSYTNERVFVSMLVTGMYVVANTERALSSIAGLVSNTFRRYLS